MGDTTDHAKFSEVEHSLYKDVTVSVTRTLFRVGSRTFPIASIGSVDIAAPDRSKQISAAIAGAIVAAIGVKLGLPPLITLAAFVVCVGAAIAAYQAPHILVIRTGSGDQQALTSVKRDYLATVQAAIETAITLRG